MTNIIVQQIKTTLPLALLVCLSTSYSALAQDEQDAEKIENASDLIEQLGDIDTGNPIVDKIIGEYTEYVRKILKSTRGLQDLVFNDANDLISKLSEFYDTDEYKNMSNAQKTEYAALTDEVIDMLLSMVILSSDEDITDNNKAFTSIGPRLKALDAILEKIKATESIESMSIMKKQFIQIASDTSQDFKFLKRFKAGIGVSYSYLPTVRYTGTTQVDLEQFLPLQAIETGNPFEIDLRKRGEFSQDFSNTSYPLVNFTAQMEFVGASIAFPVYSETKRVDASNSEAVLGSQNRRLVAKNSISTEFKPLFEAGFTLSIPDLSQFVQEHWFSQTYNSLSDKLTQQIDYGLYFGMTSFQLEDTYSSEVKFVELGQSFQSSELVKMISRKEKRNLRPLAFGAYFRIEPSDSFTLGFDVKYYDNDSDGDFIVDVDGVTVSVNATYLFL